MLIDLSSFFIGASVTIVVIGLIVFSYAVGQNKNKKEISNKV